MKLELKVKNIKAFSAWIKKFSSVENSLLLEIGDSHFFAKTYDKDKSLVKFSSLPFSEADIEPVNLDKRIKAGIYNISRLIKSLDHFSSGFSVIVNYEELVGEEKDLAATSLLIKDQGLKIKIDCASLSIFKYISDDLFYNTISKIDSLLQFELPSPLVQEVLSLCALEPDHKILDFESKGGKLFIKGKNFEKIISPSKWIGSISLFKHHFTKIDDEGYLVDIGEDRIVFKSKESNTITVCSEVKRDDKYEDSESSFE